MPVRRLGLVVVLAACGGPAPVVPPPPPLPSVEAPVPAGPDGSELFLRRWVPNNPRSHGGDGFGPVANETSCAACHAMGGPGGAGGADRNARFVSTSDGTSHPLPRFGAVTRVASLRGMRIGTGGLGGTHAVERNTPALWGAGRIDRISDADILAAAAPVEGWPSVSGATGRDADGRVGRFGWKGTSADLATFVARACAFELGLDVPGHAQLGANGDPAPSVGLDLDEAELAALTGFVRSLPAPSRREVPGATEGEALFARVGCAACHRPTLAGVDGLYSDLLLHDLGPGLADRAGGYVGDAVANGQEWRTPPLWGVADSAPWMHDGRAPTLAAAISMHDGEAAASRAAWEGLSTDDQWATLAFLASLASPPAQL